MQATWGKCESLDGLNLAAEHKLNRKMIRLTSIKAVTEKQANGGIASRRGGLQTALFRSAGGLETAAP